MYFKKYCMTLEDLSKCVQKALEELGPDIPVQFMNYEYVYEPLTIFSSSIEKDEKIITLSSFTKTEFTEVMPDDTTIYFSKD